MKRNLLRQMAVVRRLWVRRPQLMRPRLPGYYDRALLCGGGVLVSVAIIAAAMAAMAYRFEQRIDEWQFFFIARQDAVKTFVERNQARLRQAVETYEAIGNAYDYEAIPINDYRQLLIRNKGVLTVRPDIALPFTVATTLTQPAQHAQLLAVWQLIHEISPASLLYLPNKRKEASGFIYTEDHRFLAVWPPLPDAALSEMRRAHIEPFIARYVARVDDELKQHSDALLHKQPIFWVSPYESEIEGARVMHYAAPIYQGAQRIAVLVMTIPLAAFEQAAPPKPHDPDFFVLSRDGQQVFGTDAMRPRIQRWKRRMEFSPDFLQATRNVRTVRIGGNFFMTQRIAGPDWIAVYAFDWRTLALNQRAVLLSTGGFTLIVMGLLWLFIVSLDRLALAPLRSRARRVYESEAFSRTVFAMAPVGLTVFDPVAHRIVKQNDIARNLLAQADVPNETDFYRKLIENSSSMHRMHDDIYVVKTTIRSANKDKNKNRKDISAALSYTRYRKRRVVLVSLTDITRQQETVRLLRKARQAAEEMSRAKSMFVAMMSHEIRTPLYGVLGNLELLAMEALSPSQTERLFALRHAFDALLTLVDDTLDLSKSEVRELQLQSVPFHLEEILERCARTFVSAMVKNGVRFFCLIDARLEGVWRGDGQRIAQIVMNLLANACKFTRTGAIVLRATPLRLASPHTWVRISVADTGMGIPKAQQTRIFEPFVQADASIARCFGGTGLGLSLCKRLVELMGGRIAVKSAEGAGAIFMVDVPLLRESSVSDASELSELSELSAASDTLFPLGARHFDTIAIACDKPLWQRVIAARIRQWMPAMRVIDARTQKAAYHARAIAIVGGGENALDAHWKRVARHYVDVIVISEKGPLYPQRVDNVIYVSSLSCAMLKRALTGCGKPDRFLSSPYYSQEEPAMCVGVGQRAQRILIAEDDALNRRVLVQQLGALGYRHVDAVSDGSEALRKSLRSPYDLIITDMSMPLMSGRALMNALRAKGIATPIIINTAAILEDEKMEHEDFAAVLRKPVTTQQLRAVLKQTLIAEPLACADSCADSCADAREEPVDRRLRAAFLVVWPSDEAALRQAVSSADASTLRAHLHRMKGALLVLREEKAASACDSVRDYVQMHGMHAIAAQMEPFWNALSELAERYRHQVGVRG